MPARRLSRKKRARIAAKELFANRTDLPLPSDGLGHNAPRIDELALDKYLETRKGKTISGKNKTETAEYDFFRWLRAYRKDVKGKTVLGRDYQKTVERGYDERGRVDRTRVMVTKNGKVVKNKVNNHRLRKLFRIGKRKHARGINQVLKK